MIWTNYVNLGDIDKEKFIKSSVELQKEFRDQLQEILKE